MNPFPLQVATVHSVYHHLRVRSEKRTSQFSLDSTARQDGRELLCVREKKPILDMVRPGKSKARNGYLRGQRDQRPAGVLVSCCLDPHHTHWGMDSRKSLSALLKVVKSEGEATTVRPGCLLQT